MIKVILSEPQPGAMDGVKAILTAADQIEISGLAHDGLEAAQLAIQTRPDVLIVHAELPAIDGYEVCKLVKRAASEVACLLLVEKECSAIAALAMQAGANGIISPASEPEQILETITACAEARNIVHTDEYKAVTDPAQMPAVIGLISAKDGVGKTTLTINLAVLFATKFPESVVLVDLYAQLGDVNLALSLPPRGSLVELAAYADELDSELVENHLATHESSLKVLSGSSSPELLALDAISPSYLASLMGILRRDYRFIFFDLPPVLWSGGLYVLSRCQMVIVVANLFELSTIRDTNSLLRIITDSGYVSRENIKLVVNRASPKDRFSVNDLQEATGMGISFTLPNDSETVISAANKGEPFVLTKPRGEISISIGELAVSVIDFLRGPKQAKAA